MRCKKTTALRGNRDAQQFQRLFQKVNLVVPIVLLEPLGSHPVQARRATMMLRTERYDTHVARTPPPPRQTPWMV